MADITISPLVSWQRLLGEDYVYVLHSHTGEYYEFDSVAYEIWIMISEGKTVSQIGRALMSRYPDTESDMIIKDVHEFVSNLQLLELVKL